MCRHISLISYENEQYLLDTRRRMFSGWLCSVGVGRMKDEGIAVVAAQLLGETVELRGGERRPELVYAIDHE
jgi:hypothetical protein